MTLSKPAVLVVAAEESSCKYALRVMKAFQKLNKDLYFFGIGNEEMRAQGLHPLARSEDIAVMGLVEVFKVQGQIRQALKNILAEIDKNPPQVALLLDFGGFNLHLAQALKVRNIPVVYYVLPKVWAWRKKRAVKVKNYVDHALAIHPFEEEFFAELGVRAQFIGHPLLEEKQDFLNSDFDILKFKTSKNMNSQSSVLGLMPGSRRSEVKRHLNVMLDAAEKVWQKDSSVQVAILLAPAFTESGLKQQIQKTYQFPIHFIKEDSWKMVAVCDYLLTASGTATLQVGLLKKPQVVVYKMSAISARLAKWIVKIPYFSLINLILNKKSVTELFQNEVNPKRMAEEIWALMKKEDRYTSLIKDYALLEKEMQKSNATDEVVKLILSYVDAKA